MPLFLLSIMLVGLLALSTLGLVRGFDAKSRQREEALVGNGIAGRIDEVGRIVIPQVVWGDAVRRLDNRFDPEWARVNIIEFLHQTGGFERTFVIGGDGRLLIAGRNGKVAHNDTYDAFSASASPLIAAVRRAEAVRATNPRPPSDPDKTPVQANGVVLAEGKPFILTASRVQPDFHDNRLRGDNGPIVLAAMPIDGAFLQGFGQRFLLRDLAAVAPTGKPDRRIASTDLIDANGVTIAQLHWRPQRPGTDLFYRLAPGLGLLLLLIVTLAAMLFRRSRQMAQSLITSEARASHLAYHDALTGLANRVQFSDRLGQALARRRRGGEAITILCIDLDRFKDINDTYGHGVGDELLKQAARRMQDHARSNDVLARLSGDEFAIIKQGGSAAEAGAFAARLVAEIARPFAVDSTPLHIGCSVGITIARNGDADPAELLREADIALYKAKEQGKGRYCFYEQELDVAIKGRRLLEAELRRAIDAEELTLSYQPQVAQNGEVIGLEALLRWNHPERGEIAPARFVPVAEQSDLILQLGQFVIRRAFADARRWPSLRIAINISAAQIRDPLFVNWLTAEVRDKGIDPARFDFEITEGILLGDDPITQQRLFAINELGFRLALDDFGTGYSSLSYLNRYPISKIKIDRSFIANLGFEAEADAVVDAIIKLAQALGLQVVAEGVETARQHQLLIKAGCGELQGYLFGMPQAAREIDTMLDRRNQRRSAASPVAHSAALLAVTDSASASPTRRTAST